MKTNILVGIIISILLLAIPAAASDYTLGIFGNANEDDTINMVDVTYTELIIMERNDETQLADAKYDGEVDILDVTQIELIILGRENQLTLIDSADRTITVKKPVDGIVVTFRQALEMVRSIGVEEDQVVGVESLVQSSGGPPWGVNYKIFFPEYQDKPTVGLIWEPNSEAILSLQPDVVLLIAKHMTAGDSTLDNTQDVLESAGITVIRIYGGVWGKDMTEEAEKLGYIFDKQDEAGEFIGWYDGITNSIEETVDGIPEEDKPKVYFECVSKWDNADESRALVGNAGGKNIFPDLRGSVNPESIIDQNPAFIVKASWGCGGYDLDADDTVELEEISDEMMNRPELESVKAVDEGRVCVISGYILYYGPASGCRGFLQTAYMAKWFHPEFFGDMNPKAIHQEYLTRFQGLDIDLDTQGVFVYPEPE